MKILSSHNYKFTASAKTDEIIEDDPVRIDTDLHIEERDDGLWYVEGGGAGSLANTRTAAIVAWFANYMDCNFEVHVVEEGD